MMNKVNNMPAKNEHVSIVIVTTLRLALNSKRCGANIQPHRAK